MTAPDHAAIVFGELHLRGLDGVAEHVLALVAERDKARQRVEDEKIAWREHYSHWKARAEAAEAERDALIAQKEAHIEIAADLEAERDMARHAHDEKRDMLTKTAARIVQLEAERDQFKDERNEWRAEANEARKLRAEVARLKEKRCDFAHNLELARLREALEHYADESNWEDDTPPESSNTAGYLLFIYAPDRVPWSVARAALEGVPEPCDYCKAKGREWTPECEANKGIRQGSVHVAEPPAPDPRLVSRKRSDGHSL